jgi:hypothetical protein
MLSDLNFEILRKILLQKSLFSQCCRFQARLRILKCKNFPILKIYNLSNTQNFQNSLKIQVFILETYVKKKVATNYIKNHRICFWLKSETPRFRIHLLRLFYGNQRFSAKHEKFQQNSPVFTAARTGLWRSVDCPQSSSQTEGPAS